MPGRRRRTPLANIQFNMMPNNASTGDLVPPSVKAQAAAYEKNREMEAIRKPQALQERTQPYQSIREDIRSRPNSKIPRRRHSENHLRSPALPVEKFPKGVNIQVGRACNLFQDAKQTGELDSLDEAVLLFRTSIDLIHNTHSNHPSLPNALKNLGISLRSRSKLVSKLAASGHAPNADALRDLDEAIEHFRAANRLTPHDHPLQPKGLRYLATSLFERFQQTRQPVDLDDSIGNFQKALSFIRGDDPTRPMYLRNLAIALSVRFWLQGDKEDIDTAVKRMQVAIDLLPRDHPCQIKYKKELEVCSSLLVQRSRWSGDTADFNRLSWLSGIM